MLLEQMFASVFGVVLQLLQTCPRTQNQFYGGCPNFRSEFLDRGQGIDFVIVGGGSAGSILASRLSENTGWQIVLIEAGNYPSRASEVPANFIFLQGTNEDYAFETRRAGLFKGAVNETLSLPQGRALGGSSTLHAMLVVPGVPHDYDTWAQLVHPQWSWAKVSPYFKKVHQRMRHSVRPSALSSRAMLMRTARQLGIPVNDNSSMFGYKDVPTNIRDHTRMSVAKAYLKPIRHRRNLCILVNSRVDKVLFGRSPIDGALRAIGVKVSLADGSVVDLKVRKEVILTAGAFNSPKLLMLSGIGPREHLTQLGIDVVQDLPHVGGQLEDHLQVPLFVQMAPSLPMPSMRFLTLLYCATGRFLDETGTSNFMAFFNTRKNLAFPDLEVVTYEFLQRDTIFLEGFLSTSNTKKVFADFMRKAIRTHAILLFLPMLLHAKSQGVVRLVDKHPGTKPSIKLNYFQHADDLKTMIVAIRQIIEPIVAKLRENARDANMDFLTLGIDECQAHEFKSEAYWTCYIGYFTRTVYHFIGTCRMGTSGANSVLDKDGNVWGVRNLRVMDSSAVPYMPSGHTNYPVCMLAEYGADLIKKSHQTLPK